MLLVKYVESRPHGLDGKQAQQLRWKSSTRRTLGFVYNHQQNGNRYMEIKVLGVAGSSPISYAYPYDIAKDRVLQLRTTFCNFLKVA